MTEQIIKKRFSRAFEGYDIAEVDQFLDDICREFEKLANESEILKLRIELLSEELGRASAGGGYTSAKAPKAQDVAAAGASAQK